MFLLKYCLKNSKLMDGGTKYAYTVIICFVNISFGMGMSSLGPSFVDLKYILNTSMERISFFPFFISVGYIVGSLFGFLYKYLNRQLVITVLVVLMGLAVVGVPNSRALICLYSCAFVIGTCAGAWSNAKTVWLIEIWQKRSAPVLHLCSFLFGVGTIIAPLLEECYLTGEVAREVNSTLANNSSLDDVLVVVNDTDQDLKLVEVSERRARLMIPFIIIGAMQFLGAIAMCSMYLIKKYVNPNHMISENQSKESNDLVEKKLFDKEEDNTDINGEPNPSSSRNCKRILLIGCVSLFLAFQMSCEVLYMQFSATYFQYIPLKLSAKVSAIVMSSMASTFTIGRGVSVFVAMRLRPQHQICLHLAIVFLGLFLLSVGQHSLATLWVGAVIMSYGLSPIICSSYCFLAQYLDVKNRIGTVLMFSAQSLNMFVPVILGNFIERCPQIFLWVIFLNIVFSSLVFTLILFIVRRAERTARTPLQ